MNVTVKNIPESKVEMKILLPWSEWQGEIDHATTALGKGVQMPGFRPGKVPKGIVEKRLGRESIILEAAEHIVSHSYGKALEQEKIEALGEPEVTLGQVKEGEDFTYTVVTAVMPEVKLASYRDDVKRINRECTLKEEVVTEEEMTRELTRLAGMRASTITVRREAQLGDNVEIDFTVLVDGVVIEGGKSEKHPLLLGAGVFIPGFEEKLVGMKEGDEQSFELPFPVEYHAQHLAGKAATFEVKMRLVQERQVPVLDDAFAKSLGKFETLEEVKKNLRMGMIEEKKAEKKEKWRTALLDLLVEKTTIDPPKILLDQELRKMTHDFEIQLQSMKTSFPDYLKQTNKTKEEVEKEWLPQAKKRLTANLVITHLATEEEIVADSKEIEEGMNKALQYYKDVKDLEKNIDMERLYTAVTGQLRNEKVLVWLESL